MQNEKFAKQDNKVLNALKANYGEYKDKPKTVQTESHKDCKVKYGVKKT